MVSWEVMILVILGPSSLALLWSFRLNRLQHQAQRALGFYRFTVYSKREIISFLIVIGIIVTVWASPYILYEPPPPRFIGYQSTIMRIDPVNLTEIKNIGTTPNITISEERHIQSLESIRWERYLGKGEARISYSYTGHSAGYSYHFEKGNGVRDTLPVFWTKLQEYLHLSDGELQYEIDEFNDMRINHPEVHFDRYVTGGIDGKRFDFDLILADLGEVLEVDTNEIGFETTIYKDTAWSEYNTHCIVETRFNTDCLIVGAKIEEPSVSIELLIDGDSDIQLEIRCSEKLDDPTTVLVDLFEQIGLPTTILDSLELEEFYMGYI